MDAVPEDLVGLLSSAGWAPGRRIDVLPVSEQLTAAGFEVSGAAAEFLSQYAFLSFRHEPSILLDGQRSYCWTRFDPGAVATTRDARIARRCAEIAGTSLCPVGTDGFHLTLYISPGAAFFAGKDASVFRYAPSLTALLRAMRDGVRPELIGEWMIGA
ncbi:SUKH-3 domain-containing protein [Actinoplanes sp. NPDC049596]|uniref:SUKH-3 domain-containing protein n=1 Tax=unclassified Actinoplanes TaxID=2626549 RepID=UPI003416F6E5